ncbi:ABC transporter substrate-binding protein [Paenibacillus doosanensis]|uniref:Cyclodextrin-binding protein n=1 Tax=Paenibacillus konkukensis TaxID=2020716 RepID=A0ABY4RSS9_9BACL|nr:MULTISPECIES: ABC transporter substrate-binding protein [Paenibacillus]MCS7464210.1 ABC transporter substrate-binding protein [Paenibacillus doosanensis]UQZ85599.1 Cyclodextrin-binding protein precursor [Paenibacillus konkukensis]
MKKLQTSIACSLALLLLAGCSGTSGKDSQSAKQADSASGTTEISYLANSIWEKPIKKVIDEFEKENPNIKVNLQLSPSTKLTETIEIKLASKAQDLDVISVDVPLTMGYAVKGYLEPLDSLIGEDAKQKWIPSATDAGSYQGQLMAAPMNTSSVVLFYNKDLFQQAGIPFPSDQLDYRMTWENVVEVARKLSKDTNGDNQNDVFGFSFDQVGKAYQLISLGQSKNAKLLSDNGLTATGYTNSPEMVSAFQFYSDLFNKEKVSPKIKREEALDYFISGKVAMFLASTQNMPRIQEAGMNFGIAPHPYFAGGKVVTPTGSWHVGISKYSTKKEAAAKFVKYLTLGKGSQIWFNENGALPATLELLDQIDKDPKYNEFPNNIMKLAAGEARETAATRPKTPGYLEWETNVNKAFEDIKNGSDPKKALDDAATLIDSQLKKYQSVVK